MWHTRKNQVGLFFGDTSGEGFVINKNGGNGSNWRSNVVAFSSDTDLTDGLKIDSMLLDSEGKAREICALIHGTTAFIHRFTSSFQHLFQLPVHNLS